MVDGLRDGILSYLRAAAPPTRRADTGPNKSVFIGPGSAESALNIAETAEFSFLKQLVYCAFSRLKMRHPANYPVLHAKMWIDCNTFDSDR